MGTAFVSTTYLPLGRSNNCFDAISSSAEKDLDLPPPTKSEMAGAGGQKWVKHVEMGLMQVGSWWDQLRSPRFNPTTASRHSHNLEEPR